MFNHRRTVYFFVSVSTHERAGRQQVLTAVLPRRGKASLAVVIPLLLSGSFVREYHTPTKNLSRVEDGCVHLVFAVEIGVYFGMSVEEKFVWGCTAKRQCDNHMSHPLHPHHVPDFFAASSYASACSGAPLMCVFFYAPPACACIPRLMMLGEMFCSSKVGVWKAPDALGGFLHEA